jgi:hypothetical protein
MTYEQLLEKLRLEAYRVAKITLDATLHHHSLLDSEHHFLVQQDSEWQKMIDAIGIKFGGGGLLMERADMSPWDPDHKGLIYRVGELLNLGVNIGAEGQLWVFSDEKDAMMFKLTWC